MENEVDESEINGIVHKRTFKSVSTSSPNLVCSLIARASGYSNGNSDLFSYSSFKISYEFNKLNDTNNINATLPANLFLLKFNILTKDAIP